MYEDTIHATGVLKGVLLGAVFGWLACESWRRFRDRLEHRLDRLDVELCEHVHDAEHAHKPPPDAPTA